MNDYEKYLPLGSVLMLKNGKHRVMVVGYCAKVDDENSPFYDYIGCFFPEGIFTTEQSMVFNHVDIDKIFHIGFVDEEVKALNAKLKEIMKRNFNEE